MESGTESVSRTVPSEVYPTNGVPAAEIVGAGCQSAGMRKTAEPSRAIGEQAGARRFVFTRSRVDLVRRSGLPLPMFNARLCVEKAFVAVVDAWWPQARVAVEDSREWHLPPEVWEEAVRRHARVTAQGILELRFTPKQVRTEQAQVVASIRAALEAARADGQPPACPLSASG
jgi:very-short-patch-repair endonuclease